MSEYTPTTYEIRRNYSDGWRDAEFDRWLAQNNAEVAKATEERIVKLLEDENHFCTYGCDFSEAVALIEGEDNYKSRHLLPPRQVLIELIEGEQK